MSNKIVYSILIISIFIVSYCVWMEIVNIKAGKRLPRTEIDGAGNDSWRVSAITSEEIWRSLKFKDEREDYATFKLSSEQKKEMLKTTQEARNDSLLRDLATYAIFFYLLIPALMIISIAKFTGEKLKANKVLLSLSLLFLASSYFYIFSRAVFTAVFVD